MDFDTAIIGGGASGLAAAIFAARNGAKTVIIEKNPRVGKKLLLTGNGRCNLSNREPNLSRYHGDLALAEKIFALWNNMGGTESFFRSLGLFCVSDGEGRMYPHGGTAASVLDALRLEAERLGVTELCGKSAETIERSGKKLTVICADENVEAKSVIVAAGGYAAGETGSDGSGARLMKLLGHKPVSPLPSLAPIRSDAASLKALKGLRVKAEVTLKSGGETLGKERGEVQFTENALSGICVFNLSGKAAEAEKPSLYLDLLPDKSLAEVNEIIAELISVRGGFSLENLLSGLFPKRIGNELIKQAVGKSLAENASILTESDKKSLAALIKAWSFSVTGLSPWKAAQVTKGGISSRELDESLQSRFCGGVFVCGELLNIDGDCGGFNLEWAWASGAAAGTNAANYIKRIVKK